MSHNPQTEVNLLCRDFSRQLKRKAGVQLYGRNKMIVQQTSYKSCCRRCRRLGGRRLPAGGRRVMNSTVVAVDVGQIGRAHV